VLRLPGLEAHLDAVLAVVAGEVGVREVPLALIVRVVAGGT